MGKKQPEPKKQVPLNPEGEKDTSAYYRLKKQAVEDLVTANEENSPPVPAAELKKYQSGPKIKMSDWVKAILIKLWIAGMICYFFIWGISTIAINPWDQLLVIGIALGLATNLMTNNIYRFIAKTPGAYDRWMMFPGKKLYFLPLDVVYAIILTACTIMTYNGINLLAAGGAEDAGLALGVEPILFGIIVTAWDLVFLGCKLLAKRIVADAKQKVSAGS